MLDLDIEKDKAVTVTETKYIASEDLRVLYPKVEDLTGRKFNKWTVLGFSHMNSINESMWFCRCECGKERAVNRFSLLNEKSRSCGCIKKGMFIQDLTGQNFGMLTALYQVGINSSLQATWLFQCVCGNKKVLAGTGVKTGRIKSCGCYTGKEKEDITGQKFGLWTVIGFCERRRSNYYWWCKCECGTKKLVQRSGLINGVSESCGCQERYEDLTDQKFGLWTVVKYAYKRNGLHYWHCKCDCGNEEVILAGSIKEKQNYSKCYCNLDGRSKTRLYKIWDSIKGRCNNPKNRHYKNYGGRGIRICDRWEDSYDNFKDDMGEPASPKHTIDRIDINGNYEPRNCRWATRKQQANNRYCSVYWTVNGKTQTISEWAHETGIYRGTLTGRVERGWSIEKAVTTPVRKPKKNKEINKLIEKQINKEPLWKKRKLTESNSFILVCAYCKKEVRMLRGRNKKYCSDECKYKGARNPMPTLEDIKANCKLDENGCWIWQGYMHYNGYGIFSSNYKTYGVHRYVCELVYGEIPYRKVACHKCPNRACCNPDHLYVGTPADNIKDWVRRKKDLGQPFYNKSRTIPEMKM